MSSEIFKVLVAGSRDITDELRVRIFLEEGLMAIAISESIDINRLSDTFHLVSGGARGVDKFSESWARSHGVGEDRKTILKPEWKPGGIFDHGAGKKRNTDLVNLCTHAIIIWDCESGGTVDTLKKVLKQNKPVFVYSLPYTNPKQTKLFNDEKTT